MQNELSFYMQEEEGKMALLALFPPCRTCAAPSKLLSSIDLANVWGDKEFLSFMSVKIE
jgi:hypothetical protein